MTQVLNTGKVKISIDEPKKEYTWQEKIIHIDNILDIQWWLYKGALTRQPLEKSYYTDWYKTYNLYREIIDSIEDKDFNKVKLVKDLQTVKNKLKSNYEKLELILSDDVLVELSIATSKINKGIDNIIKQTNSEDGEYYFCTN